ncbi:hypothetical protein [Nocardioides sp. LML1-1-1.1]|uniref:hypothetical protein n=1 Tax=Nocardioides sp. LML1-1-1.1 TaxID=3135248 RepID=UPI0034223FFC
MSAGLDETTTRARVGHARRPLGKPCRACGSTSTWIEWRREDHTGGPDGAGEWPYAVCQACGHAAKGRLTQSPPQSPPAAPTRSAEAAPSAEAATDDQAEAGGQPRSGRPPRPKASDERVGQLLQAAGYNRAITPEVLDAHRRFATHAGKPGLPRWKAAVALLNGAQGRDEVPHVREIYAEEKRRRDVQRKRAAQRRQRAGELADEHAGAARAYVARVWAETGEGPTWRELASALGVEGPLASAMIDTLHRRGVLTSTQVPRSLAVTSGLSDGG